MSHRPAFIIPLLVEQPTWGGDYIAAFKHITEPAVQHQKIGQAFELYDGSLLIDAVTAQPPFAVATATNLTQPTFHGTIEGSYSLQTQIDADAAGVLGQRVLAKTGPRMTTLIKFTQAKNNSYQVHVKPGHEFSHWLPKPESWYYFEPGLITLGLKNGVNVDEYQNRCLAIDQYAQTVSQKIKSGELTLEAGKHELKRFIDEDHPRRFVNTVPVEKDSLIDLSGCGIHHSWEIDATVPEGNRCYEVQVDVKDEHCTLRSFDQGNIKDDGSIRPLAISEYFQALDSNPEYNRPEHFFQTGKKQTDGPAQITQLFSNQYYQTTLIEFQGQYAGSAVQMNDSFHHVFVKSGEVSLTSGEHTLVTPEGWSVFVPAGCHSYHLDTPNQAKVLVTTA